MSTQLKYCLWSLASLLRAEDKRFNQFMKGREEVNDDAYPCRLSTSTADEYIEVEKKMILNREVANDGGISFGSC